MTKVAKSPTGQVNIGGCVEARDSCITQLKAQGPSRTCNESKEEEEEEGVFGGGGYPTAGSMSEV